MYRDADLGGWWLKAFLRAATALLAWLWWAPARPMDLCG
jgi:hypothetical protein